MFGSSTDVPRSSYLLRLYGVRRHKGSSEFCFPKTLNVPWGDHWVLSEDKTHSLPWGKWLSVYLPTKKIEQNACKLFPWLRLRHKFWLGFKELYSGSRTSRMFKLWFPLGVCEFCSPWWVSEWVWFFSWTQIFSLSNARVMLINSPYTKMHLFLFPCAGSPFQLDLSNPVVFYFRPQNVVPLLRFF